MKFLLCMALSVSVLMLQSCSVTRYSVDPKDYYKRSARVSAVFIGGGMAAAATAFPIDESRFITAGHFCQAVIDAASNGEVEYDLVLTYVDSHQQLVRLKDVYIDLIDTDFDICVAVRPDHGLMPFYLSSRTPAIHEPISLVGSPLGLFPYTQNGFVIDRSETRIFINAAGTFGVSGGPVIDKNGYIIGMVVEKTSFDHVLIALPAKIISEFLKEAYGE